VERQQPRSCDSARADFIFGGNHLKSHANDNTKPVKLLRYCDLSETRGITYTRRHLYTLETERKFPRRVPLGENRVGWIESEIDDWLSQKAASRAA
jgi:prophage regulatory protein